MDNTFVSVIVKGEVNNDILKDIQAWEDMQGVLMEFIFEQMAIDASKQSFLCMPRTDSETDVDYICRVIASSRGKFVTWIDCDDVFCKDALKKMCAIFSANHEVKVVCGQFAVSDAFGEKVFLKNPPLGKERVIQRVESCFLVEKDFLLTALRACKCETLWTQYLWNAVYQQGGNIVYIDEVLLKKKKYDVRGEFKKSFVTMIKESLDCGNIEDLDFLLDSIHTKCGKDYLLDRLIGCISGEVQALWRQRHAYHEKQDIPQKEKKVVYAPYISKKALTIHVEYGGLGDNLFLSHIPRIAKESGKFDKIYLAKRTQFRSQDIYKMIWEMNPFLDGVIEDEGISVVLPKEAWTAIQHKEGNILDFMLIELGLDDGERFHEPELYYKPQCNEILQSKVIYDPNYVTNAGDSVYPGMVDRYFHENGIGIDYMLRPRGKYVTLHSLKEQYTTKSLFDFCDALHSAKDVYCYATGTATLCAAIGKSAHVLFGDNMKGWGEVFFHSKLHQYIELANGEMKSFDF